MAKAKQGKKDVDSYTIRGTNKVVRVGDCVLMRSSDLEIHPYVARVEKMEADRRGSVLVRVRWYYRPEESDGGRRQFHGAKEHFISDHFDLQSANTIEDKCAVHSFKNYTNLENVEPEDFFCRFKYKAASGAFTPDRVVVHCTCEMPYNPDDLMVQCDACKDWFHPSCIGMTIEQAKNVCSDCLKEIGSKRPPDSFRTSPNSELKSQQGASPSMTGAIDLEAATFSAKLDQMLAQIAIFNARNDPAITFSAKLNLALAQMESICQRLDGHEARITTMETKLSQPHMTTAAPQPSPSSSLGRQQVLHWLLHHQSYRI